MLGRGYALILGDARERPPLILGDARERPPLILGDARERPPLILGDARERPPLILGDARERPPTGASGPSGRIIADAADLHPGDAVRVRLHRGGFTARVVSIDAPPIDPTPGTPPEGER